MLKTVNNWHSSVIARIPPAISAICGGNRLFALVACLLTGWLLVQKSYGDTYGDFTYGLLSEDTAVIGDFPESFSGVVHVPSTITYESPEGSGVIKSASVVRIGQAAFQNCGSITHVEIPASVTRIDSWAFNGCGSMSSITIPASVTSMGEGVFSGCSSLQGVDIPNGVAAIGDFFFEDCENLAAISLPSSVTSIGDWAFHACGRLTSVIIPDSVTSIGRYAFEYCSLLASVKIGSGVTSIGDGAFFVCSALTSIVIPDNVTSLGDYPFEECTGMTSASIGKGVANLGEACFFGCTSLNRVTLSNELIGIGDWAFANCIGLEDMNIPATVTSIGQGAFEGCTQLTEITIPAEIATIGDGAFAGCTSLRSCFFLGDAPPIFGTGVFDSFLDEFTIYYLPAVTGFTSPYWDGYHIAAESPGSPRTGITSHEAGGYRCEMLKMDKIHLGFVVKVRNDGDPQNVIVIRDGRRKSLHVKDPVYVGDEVKTGSRSFVRINYLDGSNLNIGPKAFLTLKEGSRDDGPRLIGVLRGANKYYKSKKGDRIFIKSKTAALGVRGTTVTMEVSEADGVITSTSEVLEGVVDHENLLTGGVTELHTGESASVQTAIATHTLTFDHASTSLGSLWLNGAEITSFPHIVSFTEGTEINLQAVPQPTAAFSAWSGDIVSTNPDYTFVIEEDMAITGNFLELTDFTSDHPNLDSDGDANVNGISNYLDYASGQNPEDPAVLPIMEFSAGALTMRQRINGSDAIPAPQYSDNLGDWFSLEEGTHYDFSTETVTGEMRTVVIYLKEGQSAKRFFRQSFGP